MKYDLLMYGGSVYDSEQALAGEVRDIGIREGRVVEVGSNLPRLQARRLLDVSGFVVTPGLIDLHVHVYEGVGIYGIDADAYCLSRGVTTALDTGSSGALTFPGFRRFVIDQVVTNVYALLHISEQGIISRNGELLDPSLADVEAAVRVIEANRDRILGLKVRLGRKQVGDHAAFALDRALEAARTVNLPLMVHISDLAMPIDDLLGALRPGDILTHCYESISSCVLDDDGNVRDSVREATARGVLLDVGHGMGSFSVDVARQAMASDLRPHTISSDVHALNIDGPVYDQVTTLAKFLSLGMTLGEVVERSTIASARSIGLPGDLGHLQVGARADVAVFSLDEGHFEFFDTTGATWTATQTLQPMIVVKDGTKVVDHRRGNL